MLHGIYDPIQGQSDQICHCPEASAIPDGTRRSCRIFHGIRYRPVPDYTYLPESAFRRLIPAQKRSAPQRNHCLCRRSSHHRTPSRRAFSAIPSHGGASPAQKSGALRSAPYQTLHLDTAASHRHPPSCGQRSCHAGSDSCI